MPKVEKKKVVIYISNAVLLKNMKHTIKDK